MAREREVDAAVERPPAGGDDAPVGLDEHRLGLPGAHGRRHAAVGAEGRIEPRRRRRRNAVDGDVAQVGAVDRAGPMAHRADLVGLLGWVLMLTS